MRNTNRVRKTAYIMACLLGAAYIVASCSSEDTAQIVADEFVSVTGTINNLDGAAEAGVAIEGVYGSPGDATNPVTVSNSNTANNFSLEVSSNTSFYLHATKESFATINTARTALNADMTADAVGIPTVDQAQLVIDTAFSGTVQLSDYAWLAVDVVDANGNEVIGKTVSIQPIFAPSAEVYTACDGTDSLENRTTGPCPAGRQGPMYIAYFDREGEVDITVEGQKQTAPIRKGEIAVLEYVVAANEFYTISGTINDLAGLAIEGAEIEAVYTVPGDQFNPTTVTDNVGNYSLQVLKNKTTYLHMTQTGFVSVNTLKVELNADLPGVDISMPTPAQAQAVIDTAFGVASELLAGKAWLTADVYDGSGAEQAGVTFTPLPAPAAEVYTDCDGMDSGLDVTETCPSRDVPMYIGYFDAAGDSSVSANNKDTQFAPLRIGEITYLEF